MCAYLGAVAAHYRGAVDAAKRPADVLFPVVLNTLAYRPTSDTLEAMTKLCRSEAETARRAVRTVRKDAMAAVKALPADDERFKAEKEVQKLTDSFVAIVDKTAADKERTLSMV